MRGIQSFVFIIAGFLATESSHAQLGIWTSETRQLSTGTVSVPTLFGKQNGFTVQYGTLSPVASASNFGTFNAGTARLMLYTFDMHRSYFTPDSFVLEYGEAMSSLNTGGMNTSPGVQDATHIQATFHLNNPSPFSFDKALYHGLSTLTPTGHFPTLTGPGGQTINLDAVMSGNLVAGDWTFLYDIQGVYQGETGSDTGGPSHRPASFILSIPEPTSVSFALAAAALLARRRRSI